MRDEQYWIYEAEGKTNHPLFNQIIKCSSGKYKHLVEEMERKTSDIRYYLQGENSYEGKEAYTKDLIWPEIRWTITRRLKEAK